MNLLLAIIVFIVAIDSLYQFAYFMYISVDIDDRYKLRKSSSMTMIDFFNRLMHSTKDKSAVAVYSMQISPNHPGIIFNLENTTTEYHIFEWGYEYIRGDNIVQVVPKNFRDIYSWKKYYSTVMKRVKGVYDPTHVYQKSSLEQYQLEMIKYLGLN